MFILAWILALKFLFLNPKAGAIVTQGQKLNYGLYYGLLIYGIGWVIGFVWHAVTWMLSPFVTITVS